MAYESIVVHKPDGVPMLLGAGAPLFIIAGPCVIESRDHCMAVAERLAEMTGQIGLPFIFKSSFDKANRTSGTAYRGLGIDEGLSVLQEIKTAFNCCVISDVHAPEQAAIAAEVLDILQIPAFLCRQTDLLEAAGATGKAIMVKKGQFLHPTDMEYAAGKIRAAGSDSVILCERGASFGYRELVVDFRSFAQMAELNCPVVFDATHSVQIIGGAKGSSGGQRKYVPMLARAAVAAGVDGVFLETHPAPDQAPSDGPNMIPLDKLEALLEDLQTLASLPLSTRDSAYL